MTITYNTGTTASASIASSLAITIPAGVLAGDVVFLVVSSFQNSASDQAVTISSTGTAWTQIQSTAWTTDSSQRGSAWTNGGSVFYIIAGAADPGLGITVHYSPNCYSAAAMASYTGASSASPIDVSPAGAGNAAATSITCPSATTGVNGDWAVYLGGSYNGSRGAFSGPAGATQRQSVLSGSSLNAAIYDSNSSAGAAGTSIGGGTFTEPAGGGNGTWLSAFTVGVAPAQAPPPAGPAYTAFMCSM